VGIVFAYKASVLTRTGLETTAEAGSAIACFSSQCFLQVFDDLWIHFDGPRSASEITFYCELSSTTCVWPTKKHSVHRAVLDITAHISLTFSIGEVRLTSESITI
jgi:hypothetical protein